jgi:predicted site-specific integrase-resolvase
MTVGGQHGSEEELPALMGPVEVGVALGVKPQVVVNWIREGRATPTTVDDLGRLRFTPEDVEALRSGLGRRRGLKTTDVTGADG